MKHSWITASASVIVKQDILRSNALRECCCWFIVDSVSQCSDVTIWEFVKIISYKNSCFCRIYCPCSVLIGHFSVGQPEVAIRFQFSLFPGKYILQMKNCYLDTKIRKYFFCVEKQTFKLINLSFIGIKKILLKSFLFLNLLWESSKRKVFAEIKAACRGVFNPSSYPTRSAHCCILLYPQNNLIFQDRPVCQPQWSYQDIRLATQQVVQNFTTWPCPCLLRLRR